MPEQGTHFYFITLQQANARGIYTNTLSGYWTPAPGQTRLDVFNEIRAKFEARDAGVRGGVVLAFDIQPNQL